LVEALVSSSLAAARKRRPGGADDDLGRGGHQGVGEADRPDQGHRRPADDRIGRESVVPLRVSEPPSKAIVPAPASVPAKLLPTPVKVIASPAAIDSVPPLSSQTPATRSEPAPVWPLASFDPVMSAMTPAMVRVWPAPGARVRLWFPSRNTPLP
jgi:hypothetical protein